MPSFFINKESFASTFRKKYKRHKPEWIFAERACKDQTQQQCERFKGTFAA